MRRAILILSLSAATFTACDSPKPAPVVTATAAPKKDAPKDAPKPDATAATAEAPPPFVYAYIPSGKRDPFKNPLDEQGAGGPNVPIVQTACSQPLCRWDLDQLHLVGVVSGMSNPVAMVEDPQGVGHLVRRNSFMGKKGGRVTQIKHDSVVVTEIVRSGDGKPHANDSEMHLAADTTASEMQDLLTSEGSE